MPLAGSELDCPPLIATEPTPGRGHRLPQIAVLAFQLGITLTPWQCWFIRVATELAADGRSMQWMEVLLSCGRRSGKTLACLLILLDRAINCADFGGPQVMTHAFQDIKATIGMWRFQFIPMMSRLQPDNLPTFAEFHGIVLHPGSESGFVRFATGSVIKLHASSRTAGHAQYNDLIVRSEAWSLQDRTFEAGALSTIRTAPFGQMILESAEGDDLSVYWQSKKERGRKIVAGEIDPEQVPTALCEWGAPDNADWADEATWTAAMPALGHLFTMRDLRNEFHSAMDNPVDGERYWRRMVLNQWLAGRDSGVISVNAWRAIEDETVIPAVGVWIGLDGPMERDHYTATAADIYGACEVIEHEAGNIANLLKASLPTIIEDGRAAGREILGIIYDADGAIASLDIEDWVDEQPDIYGDIEIHAATSAELYDICPQFLDAVQNVDEESGRPAPEVIVVPDEADPFVKALRVARLLPRGGRFRWKALTQGQDVSPLYSISMAWWAARNLEPRKLILSRP